MRPLHAARLLLIYWGAVLFLCAVVWWWHRIPVQGEARGEQVYSVWLKGRRLERFVSTDSSPPDEFVEMTDRSPHRSLVVERIVGVAPVPQWHPWVLAFSIVPGRDGVRATFRGRTAYLTPDDLIANRLYAAKTRAQGLQFPLHAERALELLARELGTTPDELLREGRIERFVARREVLRGLGAESKPQELTASELSAADVEAFVQRAARHLANSVGRDGRFVYEVDAVSGEIRPGYNWPRHAGTTLFLAEAARWTQDPEIARSAQRAGRYMTGDFMVRCGGHTCIGAGSQIKLGSSALGLLALVELEHAGLGQEFRKHIGPLASFVRSMQRSDGEFMHVYDRVRGVPVDVQLPYYSGEAALALSRAYRVTRNVEDLDAASNALRYLTQERWAFFGSRYYFDSEHWTCQAMEDLWAHRPDPLALRFCLDWQGWNRQMLYGPEHAAVGNWDGGFSAVPTQPPRLAASGSRNEAAVATLVVGTRAGVHPNELNLLEDQIRRSLALVIRQQMSPGVLHLIGNSQRASGGVPGSPTDWLLRIDIPQHTGSAAIRYLRYLDQRDQGEVRPPP